MLLLETPNPHFIPGYTGFCPQYKYRIGDTYGTITHKVLLDPAVFHAEKLVLSDRFADDYHVVRPPLKDIDIVNDRHGDTIYKHPMVPGYEGFVPREHGIFGQRFTVQATEGLSDFEKSQMLKRQNLNEITKIGYLQDNKWDPKTLDEKQLGQSVYKLPLMEVRPECAGLLRNIPITEAPITPPSHSASPYFCDNDRPDKYLKAGFTGHVPFGYASFGKTNQEMTNSALCDFTSNYRKRLSNEWAPVQIDRPNPPVLIQPTEIYHKHIGQMPNYGGHIPGAIFRYIYKGGHGIFDWLRCFHCNFF
ncbi:unnamed protein product [Phyllotreta striolata]|uniref:Ciliary microtubule inner protein 2A-C-like domain-containing protein n=1 Tax=Phyllotreta striolata TaxID=444603 RepID=A0A9P0DX56_PHYSR|nr:unnamed protein product [Phyllotreta striolata]